MRFVKPAIFLISKSVPQKEAIFNWLNHVGCSNETAAKYARTDAATGKTYGEQGIELAGRRCYLSFEVGLNPNVTKIRADIADYINNIYKAGHGSVLEHYYLTFALEGISRVLTAELNRHRAGAAISEGSMRYILFNDIPVSETPLLTMTDEETIKALEDGYTNTESFEVKKLKTRELFKEMFEVQEKGYARFCDIWKEELTPESKFTLKKHVTSLGRRIIGIGVATGGVWTYNIRALRHLLTMRCSEAAEEEICVVAEMILAKMMEEEPVLFGDFHKNERGYWEPTYNKV